MYIDVIVLILLMMIVIMFFKQFHSFVFFFAIFDIFLRIMAFIKYHIGLGDVQAIISKYLPESILHIIDKYTNGIIQTCLEWAYLVIMVIFLVYIIKIFIKKKKF